ncbi:MAG: LysM domain-containing protein [Bryobacteraceae bacterium]|jgi:N-acetylmuramoyl-L-alanine amidase
MPVHVVKQGDCMSSIADQYGFFWETLWNHERNAQLKERRKNPNVLMAGDPAVLHLQIW